MAFLPRLAFTLSLALLASAAVAQDPLPSWNDTASKQAIVAFAERVTKQSSPDFIPAPQRIAAFDNDGTRPVNVACDRTPLRDFVDHVAGRREALIGREATVDVTEVCLLARQSADEGRVVVAGGHGASGSLSPVLGGEG